MALQDLFGQVSTKAKALGLSVAMLAAPAFSQAGEVEVHDFIPTEEYVTAYDMARSLSADPDIGVALIIHASANVSGPAKAFAEKVGKKMQQGYSTLNPVFIASELGGENIVAFTVYTNGALYVSPNGDPKTGHLSIAALKKDFFNIATHAATDKYASYTAPLPSN